MVSPTPTHSNPLPSTPTHSHALPHTATHSHLFAAHCHLFPLFLALSHSFSTHSFPLPLMFKPTFVHVQPLSPTSSHVQIVRIIYSLLYFFPLETTVMRLVDDLSVLIKSLSNVFYIYKIWIITIMVSWASSTFEIWNGHFFLRVPQW